ncbi:precorrin-8X methylmutase [Paracoccus laeviglucosivorans]|uniref:Precorrin-8X methylmutase n=2 Tax=Paracoccus laeviglucosivorans TaxID=1197861 RepID=A0A521DVI9_9RHOB|nr:precorrin-8X methylmutase [Paracoccus laeviglucosivorans]
MSFDIKGWCPGALRPMASGDGLVLRIKPLNGRLTVAQAHAIAALSARHGNGLIDLTNRANLQLRGLDAAGHEAVLVALGEMGLLDASIEAEARRNVILSPFAPVGGEAWQMAEALADWLTRDASPLPGKFGFTVDDAAPVLTAAPADIRLIRGPHGWQCWPEGANWFLPGAEAARTLTAWFVANGGIHAGRGRMRDVVARASPPSDALREARPAQRPPLQPGAVPQGQLLGFAFGQITADQLAAVDAPVRLTPWRMLLLETPSQGRILGTIKAPGDPMLRISACTGAPRCPQGLADVRRLARRLAPLLGPRTLHVSGCAKGCAHRGRADLTLVAVAADRFDLIRDGTVVDAAVARAQADDIPRLIAPPAHDMTAKTQGTPMHIYETDGAAIYRQSFATIRAEADLGRFSPEEEPVVVRMIHAAGLVGLERDVVFSSGMAEAAQAALAAGAPILCDARMVSEGITRPRLPADNRVICTLHDPRVPDMAAAMGNTRSAAALELWREDLAGAVVAIGNAPTALFHLLNMLRDPACPRPAAIIGCPVGFVGAAESKDALMADLPVPALIVRGRLGGSAITVAAVNALASRKE